MKYQKGNVKKKKQQLPFKITHTTNKILRNKPDQGGEGLIG